MRVAELNRENHLINTESLSSQVYETIKDWILNLNYSPGERLDTQEIGNRLNVSHAPVRDAMNRLLQEKLIKVKPRVGYFVAEVKIEDVEKLWSVRQLLELAALEEKFNPIPEKELNAFLKLLESYAMEDDISKVTYELDTIDIQLHRNIIIGRSENNYIKEFYQSILNRLTISMHLGHRYRKDLVEHKKIAVSWLTDNYEETRSNLLLHLNNVKTDLELQIREE